MAIKYFLGVLCLLASTTFLPVLAETSKPVMLAQFFDIGPSPPPTTFKEIIPLKNEDPKSLPEHLFEWHPRLLLIHDGSKASRRYVKKVKAIVKSLGLNKKNLPVYARNDLRVYVRNVSSLLGRIQLAHDKLPAREIKGPLPVMNMTTGENQPMYGFRSDEEITARIKDRMGLR